MEPLDENKLLAEGNEAKKFTELQDLLKQIDLCHLKKKTATIEKGTSGSKKRKISNAAKKHEMKLTVVKDLEETTKQIDLVKKTLQHICDMEHASFKEVMSRKESKKRQIRSKRYLIERIAMNGRAIPLWVGRPDEQPPPLCGGIEADDNYVAQVGELACAMLGKDDSKNWALVEITAYDSENKKYTVDDIYEDRKSKHIVDKDDVIILPKYRANPKTNPEALYPVQSSVLALCPQTTCFYRGVIFKQPKKANESYMVMFEDNRYECNYAPPDPVEQRYVLHYRPIEEYNPDEEETEEEN